MLEFQCNEQVEYNGLIKQSLSLGGRIIGLR